MHSINNNYNQSLEYKLKKNIDQLTNLQKNMNLNYLIVKKLDFNQEFLNHFRLEEDLNTFQCLQKLSNNGKLNYQVLKSCGSTLMFKIDHSTSFDEVEKKCCDVWGLNREAHCLYDDAFNNIGSCSLVSVNDFFSNYHPSDITLRPGEVVLYYVESLKNQNILMDCQIKSIDSKNDGSQNELDKTRSIGEHQLNEVVGYIEKGKILGGVDQFRQEKIDERKNYMYTTKIVDNNIIYIISSVLFIVSCL